MNTTPVAADPVPQTVDVTGLTPDAVRAVEVMVRAFRGQPIAGPTAAASPTDGPPPGETAEEWIARFKAWTSRQPVRSITVDDSRESIYGEGE